jgi:hypothetical protein
MGRQTCCELLGSLCRCWNLDSQCQTSHGEDYTLRTLLNLSPAAMLAWIFLRPGKTHVPCGCGCEIAEAGSVPSDPSHQIYPSVNVVAGLAKSPTSRSRPLWLWLCCPSGPACEPTAALAFFIPRSKEKRIRCACAA